MQYWPKSLNGRITPGNMLNVTLSSSLPYAEYEIREFEVNSVSESLKYYEDRESHELTTLHI